MVTEIARRDVQELSGRQQVQDFFAALGYDTDNVTPFTTQTLGITNDLRHSITSIERVALLDDGWSLQVFLFEMKSPSVTKQQTRELTRIFNNRGGDFLLVLTTNYQHIDFVLVADEKLPESTPEDQTSLFGIPQPRKDNPYSRTMTVNRRNPDRISLRVLRLFMYHADESVYDYVERLRSAYMVSYWSEAYFNNRALFSDYYLSERLPDKEETPEWDGESSQLRHVMQTLRNLYASVKDEYANQPRAVVQEQLIRPVLELLGFSLTSSTSSASSTAQSTERTPDYVLQVQATQGQAVNTTVGFCLVYPWQRDLDRKLDSTQSQMGDDPNRENDNPGAAVVTLLEQGSASWGILTNGKYWRLYSASAHSRATNYYEIDLDEIINQEHQDQARAFKYFWFLFRAEAFRATIPTSDGTLISKLDQILQHSVSYAHEVGEQLKNLIFDQIFQHFAQGFVNYAQQHQHWPTALLEMDEQQRSASLQEVFNATLTFLYRLLFLLYAESRNLLPVREISSYYGYSLEHLKVGIAEDAGTSKTTAPLKIASQYSATATGLYDNLRVLFGAIDKGSRDLNVPIYNGGLFMTTTDAQDSSNEARTARFLSTLKIPDRELALGLDLLARVEEKKGASLVFVDYKSLGVRQLGSIYEGLLEFRLRAATEVMAVVSTGKGKKTEQIISQQEAIQKKQSITTTLNGAQRLYQPGNVYLENDKHERKATGSYYTPDYIVKYIVANTVGPVLDEKFAKLTAEFRNVEQDLRTKMRREKIMRQQHLKADDAQLDTYNKYKNTLNEIFFDLKVLDPAMGSGHFLVETVDYITDRMTRYLDRFSWNPVYYHLQVIRREIQQQMEEQGIQINIEKLTDINLLKRQVLKRCIYGVDLNPMAVELAKVSVWLDSFTLGAPLSFLDHHLKCGNSLIGEDFSAIRKKLAADLWGSQYAGLVSATQLIRNIVRQSDSTAAEVARSRSMYKDATTDLAPIKRQLNVWVGEYYGIKGAQELVNNHGQKILDGNYQSLTTNERAAIEQAYELAIDKHLFHWDLEFPEVFLEGTERKADAGFNAVVGNPPYVRQEGLADDKNAFKQLYSVFNSIADLYTYFIEKGNKLLSPGGRFGMITANKFIRANYGATLRTYLTNEVKLEKLIDFGDLPVFGDAVTYPIIILTTKTQHNGKPIEYALIKSLKFINLDDAVNTTISKMPESAFEGINWSLAVRENQSILDKLNNKSASLKDFVNDNIYYGIKTGYNEAFVIDKFTRDKLILEDPNSAEVIKPFLAGENVRRYEINYVERYLIFTRKGIDLAKYKAITRHLLQYKTELEPRPKSWDEKTHGSWAGRKPGSYKWYEIQDNIAYYKEFDKPKIIFPNICDKPEFTIDEKGYYSNQKTFIISVADAYLLSILNSKIMSFIFEHTLPKLRGNFYEPGYIFMKEVPIRRITFPNSEHLREYHSRQAHKLFEDYLANPGEQQSVLNAVEHHLAQKPEQSDVVHDVLALLAEEMLRLNREKRDEQKRFLDYVEKIIKLRPDKDGHNGIDTLQGKQKIMEYAGDYQKADDQHVPPEELLSSLRKNKQRFGIASLDMVAEQIVAAYEQSLHVVLPLKEQLKKTDALIDEIVYRLYGLTDAEIRVVKGE
ncbi:hypothetical protein ccbrp13_24140 [Ktedonobacteria bacterium brp13]|nr:hypothetical protein ccbrp13_24140 [Ktedonobacteria bacterium brp13]